MPATRRRSRRAALTAGLAGAVAVLASAGAAFSCAPRQGSIALSPASAPPGQALVVKGDNFTAGAGVKIYFGPVSQGKVVAAATPGSDRTFSATFAVPPVAPDQYAIHAVQSDVNGVPIGSPAAAVLEVQAPPEPPTTTTSTTAPPPTTTTPVTSPTPAPEPVGESPVPPTGPPATLAPAAVSGAAPAVTATNKAQTTTTAPTPATAPSVPSVAPAVPAPPPVAESDPSPAAAREGRATPASATRSPAGTEDPRGEGVGGVLVAFGVVGTAGASALGWSALRRRART